ncbi:MAG: hypothetical protein VZS44_05275 [Bacilli bacterium]|nr:hypothetical protein [Bacilli bacterium]
METKTCTKCGIEKNLEDFRYRKWRNIHYYVSICKECERENNRIRSLKYHYEHREEILKKQKERYENHKDEYAIRSKKYREENSEKVKDYERKRNQIRLKDPVYLEKKKQIRENYKSTRNELEKYRRSTDSVYKLKGEIRNMLNTSFNRKNTIKKSHTEDILGCSIDDFINYLLQTYYNNYNSQWDGKEQVHIDHIIPLSTAKTEEDVLRLCHYTNLQLLKAKDNLVKNNKLDWSLSDDE